METPSTRLRWSDVVAAVIVAAILSSWGLGIPPVADDWPVVRDAEVWSRDGRVVQEALRPQVAHWSPLWFLSNAGAYRLSPGDYGTSLLAVERFLLLLMAGLCLLALFRRTGLRGLGFVAALALWAFHQAGVGGLLQWKAIGSVGAHAFGAAAIVVLLDAETSRRWNRFRGVLAALLLLVGLLFKETALAWGLLAAVLVMIRAVRSRGWRLVRPFLPAMIVCVGFVVFRHLLGTPSSLIAEGAATAERYRIAGPVAWVKNAILMFGATVTPVSTVRWIDAVRAGSWLSVTAFSALTLVFNWLLISRAIRSSAGDSGRRALLVTAGVGLVAGVFPVFLMAHVSEAYTAPMVFWYAVVFAMAFSGFAADGARAQVCRLSTWVLVAGLLVHLLSFGEKRAMMKSAGLAERAAAVEAGRLLAGLPAGSRVCVSIARVPDSYSHYRVFKPGPAVEFELVRRDLNVHIVTTRCEYLLRLSPAGPAAGLERASVKPDEGGRKFAHRMSAHAATAGRTRSGAPG